MPVRRALLIASLLAVAATSCDPADPGTTAPAPSSASPITSTSAPTSSATTSPPIEPSHTPDLPTGLPTSYPGDVPSAELPLGALVPPGTQITGSWYGVADAGEAVAIAWQVPGPDPFRLGRGLAIWRRFDDGGAPWRPVAGTTYAKRRSVLGVSALTVDVTGDVSDDLLVRADTGGSGGCARYAVWDLDQAAVVFERALCDGRIDPSPSPVGLQIVEAVFEPGDAHCCPSATRTRVLTYVGDGAWETTSDETTDV